MNGSILDAMAEAVEKSSIVLICVCEKYKLSENCQLEAKYAHKLHKEIIPIIMEKGYEKVDGWLGILLSDRLYVNFMKKPFDECFVNLKAEIDKKLNFLSNKKIQTPKQTVVPIERSVVADVPKMVNSPEKWSSDEVKIWFKESNLPECICKAYSYLDGDSLKQLYLIFCSTPEFFYQSIAKETDNQLKLSEVAVFISKLKKCFEG